MLHRTAVMVAAWLLACVVMLCGGAALAQKRVALLIGKFAVAGGH